VLRQVNKPYSESCVQNRDPILSVLREVLVDCHHALEIGSGTGQHAVYFAEALAPLIWQCSDVEEHHAGINAWIDDYSGDNLRRPIALNVTHDAWPKSHFDAIYSANTAHIMSESDVEAMFEGVGRLLPATAPFVLYGPFNIDGQYTAESNERFDYYLREQDPQMGVRDVAWLEELADKAGLTLERMVDMPADNKTLIWRKL
jgi:cyclopropane fatty-acyl-phospholipid synthase-like methyltransferase